MTRLRRFALFTLLFASLAFIRCAAADDNDQDLFTDPAKAGADYETQGEYLGSLQERGELALGMQVIALGDGKFDVVVYKNGLPGAGWSRGEDTIKGVVQRGDDGVVRGEVKGKQVKIADGEVTVTNGAEVYGKLKKADRKSPTLGAKPPEGATVLFDGSSAEHFNNGKIVQERLLLADCDSKQKLGDHTLHLEFRTPFKPKARGQARGNSGMYLQSRYEVQVLDSFGLEGKNNECGGIYSIAEPAVNMCLPPLVWQTYDVEFTAAKYENGKKIANARTTIKHNGVVIHDDLELPNGTPGRQAEGPDPAPLYLQGHGNPVVYRNIWVVTK